jgi:hypothetical protein
MKPIAIILAAAALLASAPAKRTFTGVVTDTMCGADHAAMGMKPDSKCVNDCVKTDPSKWKYAVVEGKNVYTLSDQKAPEKFAGQKVKVTGTLNESTKTIQVHSIAPAK